MQINELAVLAAAVSTLVLAGVWYGLLFKHVWSHDAGVDAGVDANRAPKHPARVFAAAFVASLIAAATFAWFIGPAPGLRYAVEDGLLTGLAIVAMSFGISQAFTQRSLKLWLIDGGYHTLQFTLYGLVIGLWQ